MTVATANPPSVQFARLRGDIALAYSQCGAGAVPLVCLPGYSLTLDSWERFAARLPTSCRSYAYDLRGFGRSSHPGDYDLAQHADDLCTLMDALGLERAVIVAHSLGGTIAQMFAVAHPGRIAALVLCNSRSLAVPPADAGAHRLAERLAAYGTPEQNRAAFQERMPLYFDAANLAPGELERFVEAAVPSDTDALRDTLKSSHNRRVLAPDALARVTAPVLVVGSDRDSITTPAVLAAHATVFDRTETVLIRQCGHTPSWEKPDAFTAAVAGFLARNGIL